MSKGLKNRMLARVVVLAFMGMMVAGCNKYDKMDILGEWTIDLKAAKGITDAEYVNEYLVFNSGAGRKYKETHEARAANFDRWIIEGTYERKNNKITFSNRVSDKSGKLADVSYKYRIEGDNLILIVKDEGFAKNEKIYTRRKAE